MPLDLRRFRAVVFEKFTLQRATAVRVVTSLEAMETMWALPWEVRCVSLGWLGGSLAEVRYADIDLLGRSSAEDGPEDFVSLVFGVFGAFVEYVRMVKMFEGVFSRCRGTLCHAGIELLCLMYG
jgi:hypothetical protein